MSSAFEGLLEDLTNDDRKKHPDVEGHGDEH